MNTVIDTLFLQFKTLWSLGGTEGMLLNERDNKEESDDIDDFETQKEHSKIWPTCHDTRTLCRDIGQHPE